MKPFLIGACIGIGCLLAYVLLGVVLSMFFDEETSAVIMGVAGVAPVWGLVGGLLYKDMRGGR